MWLRQSYKRSLKNWRAGAKNMSSVFECELRTKSYEPVDVYVMLTTLLHPQIRILNFPFRFSDFDDAELKRCVRRERPWRSRDEDINQIRKY